MRSTASWATTAAPPTDDDHAFAAFDDAAETGPSIAAAAGGSGPSMIVGSGFKMAPPADDDIFAAFDDGADGGGTTPSAAFGPCAFDASSFGADGAAVPSRPCGDRDDDDDDAASGVATAAAAEERVAAFREGLDAAQRDAFAALVADHDARTSRLEESAAARAAEVELLKGEVTRQHAQIRTLLEEGRGGADDDGTSARSRREEGGEALLVATLRREIAELRSRLEASEAAAPHPGGQKKEKKGRSPLKKKLSRVLLSRKK